MSDRYLYGAWVAYRPAGQVYDSAVGLGAATFLKLQHDVCKAVAFYSAQHTVTRVECVKVCEACESGKVKRCKAPKRHANGYHGDRCYKVCPTCKGKYQTILDQVTGEAV